MTLKVSVKLLKSERQCKKSQIYWDFQSSCSGWCPF